MLNKAEEYYDYNSPEWHAFMKGARLFKKLPRPTVSEEEMRKTAEQYYPHSKAKEGVIEYRRVEDKRSGFVHGFKAAIKELLNR